MHSAGVLLYRYHAGVLQVMLVHPGGPFWAKKDIGAWTIPKGQIEVNEEPLAAAKREFQEETGFAVEGQFIQLGELMQPSKKIIHVWALEGDIDVSKISSNSFTLNWPGHAGHAQDFPEVDKGAWFDLPTAKKKIIKGQAAFLDNLQIRLKQSE